MASHQLNKPHFLITFILINELCNTRTPHQKISQLQTLRLKSRLPTLLVYNRLMYTQSYLISAIGQNKRWHIGRIPGMEGMRVVLWRVAVDPDGFKVTFPATRSLKG